MEPADLGARSAQRRESEETGNDGGNRVPIAEEDARGNVAKSHREGQRDETHRDACDKGPQGYFRPV